MNLHIASATSRKVAASADDECDSDDISELDDTITAYNSLLSILPTFSPSDTGDTETFSLYHGDMSSNNILIDPTAHCITGIVDWECVTLEPSWKVAKVPKLLDVPEVDDGSLIPAAAPPPDKDADGFDKQFRDRLEQMPLRCVFNEELAGKPEHGSRERLFENKIYQAKMRPIMVRKWANRVQHGSDPFPTKTEGDLYFLSEH